MKYDNLGESASIKTISENNREGVYEIEGLYTGYGITIGNALRRVLLSSLPGAAITQVKIKGVSHEFTAIPGVTEDMVEIMLNLKRVRFRIHTDEPQTLKLSWKGEGKVTASEIETNASVELITPDAHIATVTEKSGELEMEVVVEKGLGYVPAEMRKSDKLPIGVIALDAIFSPVISVNFSVENMRVGDRTDYNRLRLSITTEGSITPSQALKEAARILKDYFMKFDAFVAITPEATSEKPESKKRSTKSKKASKE
jgi:DNA-directed RNA polymerase subunit alpha